MRVTGISSSACAEGSYSCLGTGRPEEARVERHCNANGPGGWRDNGRLRGKRWTPGGGRGGGWFRGGVGVGLLWGLCGAAPALVSLTTVLVYLFAYTPLKPVTPHATLVGAVPGALPPLIGYS